MAKLFANTLVGEAPSLLADNDYVDDSSSLPPSVLWNLLRGVNKSHSKTVSESPLMRAWPSDLVVSSWVFSWLVVFVLWVLFESVSVVFVDPDDLPSVRFPVIWLRWDLCDCGCDAYCRCLQLLQPRLAASCTLVFWLQ